MKKPSPVKLAKLSGKTIEVPFGQDGDWTFEKRPGAWTIAQRSTEKGIERVRIASFESRGKFWLNLGGTPFYGEWLEVERGTADSGGARAADFTAQFPGKVRKILVQDGQKVEADAPLVLMEAMKMEFALKAPVAGTVKKLLVKEGQQVQPGERLLDFEAEARTPVKEDSKG